MFAGVIIGLALGVLLQHTHYCTMGALSDVFLFKSFRRLRVWGLGAATAILGTQALIWRGIIDLSGTIYHLESFAPFSLFAGGCFFGWGMVMAGGCASRNFVRAGSGSLKALFAVLVMLITAAAVGSGPLSFLHKIFGLGLDVTALPTQLPMLFGIILATILATSCLFRQIQAGQYFEMATGLLLGLIAVLAWPLSMSFAGQIPPAPVSLDLVSGSGDLLLWLTIDKTPRFGAALMIGTFAGAFSLAMMTNCFRIETFSNSDDMIRHALGGLAMGIGGALCLGGTLGQGISGMASLSISSAIALGGIAAGTRLALKQLEAGGFWAMIGSVSR